MPETVEHAMLWGESQRQTQMKLGEHAVQHGNQLVSRETKKYDQFYQKLPQSGAVLLSCGDDRNATAKNAAKLAQELQVQPEQGFLRIFGALVGEVRTLGVSIIAQHGHAKLLEYGKTFDDLVTLSAQRFKGLAQKEAADGKLAVIATNHSAEKNEENPVEFNPHLHTDVGCAFCALLGAVNNFATNNDTVISLSQREQNEIINNDDERFLRTAEAANDFGITYFGDTPSEYGVSRQQFSKFEAPVVVLAGAHADPEQASVIVNLVEDDYSNPLEANAAGLPFYNVDAAKVIRHIQQAFPELQLRREVLLSAILLDTTATRAALAGGDPTKLQLVVRGTLSD